MKNKLQMRRLILILSIISLFSISYGQSYLKTVKLGTVKSNYQFSEEWQYVSSDLYMFNTQKFADILNKIISGKKHFWFRRPRYNIRNILVTMNLKGLGGVYDQLTFPLFNYKIEVDQNGNYKITTHTSEVTRIIDNYPVPAIKDFITANVSVQVITKDKQVQVYKLAASQLEKISMLATNPTTAVMQLVGEFGKMIEAVADNKQYQFNSTIRIYNNENFNQKLYSVVVFVFLPSSVNEFNLKLNLDDLKKYIENDTSPVINRKILYKYIKIKKYPYAVIVNYKSKYIPDVPEEVDFDIIKARENKLQSDLNRGVINKDIYDLEKQLLGYLKLYAQLQLDLHNYFLNLENRTTEDFSMFYYYIMRDYWQMRNYYNNVFKERAGNRLFKSEFASIYKKFATKANVDLSANPNLQNIKSLVNTLFYLENTPKSQLPLDSASVENYLASLNSVPLPKSETTSPQIQLINKWKNYLDNLLYTRDYQRKILQLSSLPVNDQTYRKVLEFQQLHSSTQCELCKQKINEFVQEFMKKYKAYKLQIAQDTFEQVQLRVRSDLIDITKKLSCIKTNLDNYPGTKPAYIQLIEQNAVNIDQDRQTLLGMLNKNYLFTNVSQIEQQTTEMENLLSRIKEQLRALCKQDSDICSCEKAAQYLQQKQQQRVRKDTAQSSVDTTKSAAQKVKSSVSSAKSTANQHTTTVKTPKSAADTSVSADTLRTKPVAPGTNAKTVRSSTGVINNSLDTLKHTK